jgi:hypothetical protein
MIGVVLLWSGGALADPFVNCDDARSYGYNVVRNLVSASYNRARCNRDAATEYEQFLVGILPTYLANMGERSTSEGQRCLLEGSYDGWLDTTQSEYDGCAGVGGFDAISRSLLGSIAGSLFNKFFWLDVAYYTQHAVPDVFAYPYEHLDLKGFYSQCEAEIRVAVSGIEQKIVTALVHTVCR